MVHRTFGDLRQDLMRADDMVDVGGIYRHNRSGDLYTVEGFTILEVTDEVAVRYCPVSAEDIEFTRPLHSFIDVITIDGQVLPRFERQPD